MTAAFAITVLAIAWVVTLALLFITLSGSAQMLDDERKRTDRNQAERDAARAANMPADTLGTGSPVFDGLAVERLHDDLEHWGKS